MVEFVVVVVGVKTDAGHFVDGYAAVEFGFPVGSEGVDRAEGNQLDGWLSGCHWLCQCLALFCGRRWQRQWRSDVTAGRASSGTRKRGSASLCKAVIHLGQVILVEAVVMAGPG